MSQEHTKVNLEFEQRIAKAIMEHQNLSCFDDCYSLGIADIHGQTANKLAENFYHPINEEDIFTSKRYAQILDALIDGVVSIRYQAIKKEITLPNIDHVYYFLKSSFEEVYWTEDETVLSSLATYFYKSFASKQELQEFISVESIYQKIEVQYNIFTINQFVKYDEVAQLLSSLLNEIENTFKSREKKRILKELTTKLPLTKKKQKTAQTGLYLKKIDEYLINQKYEELHTTKETLKKEAISLRETIPKCQKVKKAHLVIDDDQFTKLEEQFALGKLTKQEVMEILKIDENLAKYIQNKYTQLKLGYIKELDKTQLTDQTVQYPSYGFHYNNYQIASNQRYAQTLVQLFFLINEQDAQYLMNHKEDFQEIEALFFFTGLFEELQTFDVLTILTNYKRIKWKLGVSKKIGMIWKKIGDILAIADGYTSITDIEQAVLGNSINQKIPVIFQKEYLAFYLQMLEKEQKRIPLVVGTFEDLTYQSGDYHNPERLLIGRNCGKNSCIDLKNIAGKRTYQKVLLEEDGDVILFKKKQTDEFYGRILLFRKGNFVILANPVNALGKIDKFLLNEKLLRAIGEQILSTAKLNGDNIEFVFVAKSYVEIPNHSFPIIEDKRFYSCFPHADLTAYAYLICASKPVTENVSKQLDVKNHTIVTYPRVRKLPTNEMETEHLNRLKALAVLTEEDEEKRNELAREYEPFQCEEYRSVIVGDDWYVALRSDNKVEELLLHEKNLPSVAEFVWAKKQLLATTLPKLNQNFLGR